MKMRTLCLSPHPAARVYKESPGTRESITQRKHILLLSKPSTPDTMYCNNFSGAVFPGCYWGSYGYPLGYSVGCGYGSTYSPVGYGLGYGYNGCGAYGYRRYWPFALC
ncbi:hypothetical protein MC885_000996 [Smutsia gigantea]|nr:hypothetical protein MC885_000996 [Smutsia gigantea]